MDQVLKQTVKENVLLLTIDRPKAMNALNRQVFDGLESCFMSDLSMYAAVVIAGSGTRAFAAGADIKEFLDLSKGQAEALSQRGQRIFRMIEQCRIPVIAAVEGFALGGGCELAMACHMIVASEGAKFGQPEVKLGLIPGYGATQRLVEALGRNRALEYLLTAKMMPAPDAYRFGLVNRLCADGTAVESALGLCAELKQNGPYAMGYILDVVNGHHSDGFDVESAYFGQCIVSEEAKEGIGAFLEKRSPKFKYASNK